MISSDAHRPRNVDWSRASALLYGDWGTSKAYVIGLAFAAMTFASMPIILAVCVLTGLVGINYAVICRCFPDGGGVYSAARSQGRTLAVIGALMLVADLLVTASLSAYEAIQYIGIFPASWTVPAAVLSILALGGLNAFGPKHSGSLAVLLAIPTFLIVVVLILLSAPHLTTANFEAPHVSFAKNWVAFVNVILALSGVEAIANLTGVMKLDRRSTPEKPQVGWTAIKAITPVAIEVTIGTALLGWAMLSIPKSLKETIASRQDDMLRYLGEYYGNLVLGPTGGHLLGIVTGVVFFLLLMSAVNTAIVALIGLLYMMARDGELPAPFLKLNKHGVPLIPLVASGILPAVILLCTGNLDALAGLYAIGVVSAISLNLGSCSINKKLPTKWHERALMMVTFFIVAAVGVTLAKTKPEALFFVVTVLVIGLSLRSWSQKRSGLETVTVHRDVAQMITPETLARLTPSFSEGTRILVAARGLNPVLKFALDEARVRKGSLYVLYVKEIAVFITGGPTYVGKARWQDDPQAATIMTVMAKLGEETDVPVVPIYAVSQAPANTILDLAATLGVDMLMLGSSHRQTLGSLLKGNVVTEVASGLPEDIQLVIYG